MTGSQNGHFLHLSLLRGNGWHSLMTFRTSEPEDIEPSSPYTITCGDCMKRKRRKERKTAKGAGRKNKTFPLAGSQQKAGNSDVNKTARGDL